MKNWSNKELDGTIFICVILFIFTLNCVFTYLSPAFAKLSTTVKTFEIIKDILLIIVGYLFRKASEAQNGNGSGNKENPTP